MNQSQCCGHDICVYTQVKVCHSFCYTSIYSILTECCVTLFPSVVPPIVMASDGITRKTTNVGDPITISFTVMNEPDPPVTKEGIQWEFIGSNGTVNLNCTSTSKYTFSSDCLNLTVNNTAGSDAGLYQIILTNVAGTVMSTVELSVSGGQLCMWSD